MAPQSYTDVRFSFMIGGPRFRAAIPSFCNPVPELSTPLGNGHGARSFDFLPHWQVNQIPPEYPLITSFTDSQGRAVDLYRWLEEPPQWYLRWPLQHGNLWTHLRPEDGEEMAETTVAAVSVVEDSETGLPFILAEQPLRSAVSARAGYQEFCVFLSSDEPAWSISIQRPSHVPAGKLVLGPGNNQQKIVRAGTRLGAEIQVIGPTDVGTARDVLNRVAASFGEG